MSWEPVDASDAQIGSAQATSEPAPIPATMASEEASGQECAPWREILALDAQQLGRLAKDTRLDRALRAELRPLVWRLWQVVAPAAADEGEAPAFEPTVADLKELVRVSAEALRRCGDDRGGGAWPIQQMRIHKPFGDRVVVPPSARQTQRLALTVARHFAARLALTPARLKWFEDRANSSAPTSVAHVRQPEADAERLGLELLRKRGSSKYS